ncbi:MAG: rhodanese-like domain-containing protein [Candidatus Binataceae bacterium]
MHESVESIDDPMSSTPSIADVSGPAGLASRLVRDLAGVILIALLSLGVGLTINWFSTPSLPIIYQTPEQRFDLELTSLVAAPPFKIAPAATVGLAEFRSAVASKNALILDARPSVFFEQGHVPGAINLARDDFAQDYRHLAGVLKAADGKPIIVYCSGGECHDSRLVANALLTLGFGNVRVFTGGWDAWSAASLPVATGIGP